MHARFSLIVPAYNEAQYLPRLLDSVRVATEAYARLGGGVEVIVADNASTDGTAAVAAAHGARVVREPRRLIAAARNAGARAASGELLAFVDADTVRLHQETFVEIDRLMASGRYVAGATGVDLERWSLGLATTWALFLSIVALTGMDTGVVFCRRDDYTAVGGYDERRPVGEDVAFLMALKRLGRKGGRRLVRARRVKAVASTRKFDQHGDWHFLSMGPRVALQYARGRRSAGDDAYDYWYRPGR